MVCFKLTIEQQRFAAENLHRQPDVPNYDDLIDRLAADDRTRTEFLAACLELLGLEVNKDADFVLPSLTSLHLTAEDNQLVEEVLFSWQDAIDKDDGQEFIKAEVDTFRIRCKDSAWDLSDLKDALSRRTSYTAAQGIPDYTKIIKDIVAHENSLPDTALTPRFNHTLFYSSLRKYRQAEREAEDWGSVLLYGDVVTSTNSLLEKYVVATTSIAIFC